MKALVSRDHKFRVQEIPRPALREGELLLQVAACGVCFSDVHKIRFQPLEEPVVLGHVDAELLVGTYILIGEVSGKNENFALEVPRPQAAHEFQAAHPRHAMVGDDDVERPRGGADLDQRLPPVRGPYHSGHWTAQDHGEDLRHSLLVLHCQYL